MGVKSILFITFIELIMIVFYRKSQQQIDVVGIFAGVTSMLMV